MQMPVKIPYECFDLFLPVNTEVSWCSLTKGVTSEVTGICVLAPDNFTGVCKIILQIEVDLQIFYILWSSIS